MGDFEVTKMTPKMSPKMNPKMNPKKVSTRAVCVVMNSRLI